MKHFVKSLPVLSILLALACDILLPDSAQHPAAEHRYFTWALLIGLAVYVIALLISLGNTKVRDKLSYSALFYAGDVYKRQYLLKSCNSCRKTVCTMCSYS